MHQKVVVVGCESKVGSNSIVPDSMALDTALNNALALLASEGYKATQISPIEGGYFNSKPLRLDHTGLKYTGEGAYGYGCSYTSGFVILAEKIS